MLLSRYLHENTNLVYDEEANTVTATLKVLTADGVRLVLSPDNSTIAVGIPEKLGGEVSLNNCNENYMLDILKKQGYNILECLLVTTSDNRMEKSCTATWTYKVGDTVQEESVPTPKVVKVKEQTPPVQNLKATNTKIK